MQELFGPLKRAHITQEVAEGGHWSGSTQGLRVRFDLITLAAGRRVAWYVKGAGWSGKGVAGTVFDALAEIQQRAAHRESLREMAPTQGCLF